MASDFALSGGDARKFKGEIGTPIAAPEFSQTQVGQRQSVILADSAAPLTLALGGDFELASSALADGVGNTVRREGTARSCARAVPSTLLSALVTSRPQLLVQQCNRLPWNDSLAGVLPPPMLTPLDDVVVGEGGSELAVAASCRQADASECVPCAAPAALAPALRILILFAGRRRPKSLRRSLERLGVIVVALEVLDDPREQDLAVARVQCALLARVEGGEFDAVFLAPPCNSFCLALQPVLRSRFEPEGMTPVPVEWAGYLRRNNALVQFTADVCMAADQAGAAWFIENPASREAGVAFWPAMANRCLMWHMPAMQSLVDTLGAVPTTFAQCGFAAEYQKYTTLLCSSRAATRVRKSFAHKVCSCDSHAKVAKGRDEFGNSLSAPAAEYPPAMCDELALVLVDSALLARAALEPALQSSSPCMGSADPHLLQLDDDKVPRHRRVPTFSLRAHASASREELRARPVARLNAAEPTKPLDRAAAVSARRPACEAPVVTSLDEILKPIWRQRLNTWMRRLRRCMRLVASGEWRKARRMRPPDLWVSAAESMQPEVADWDWDLTGLAEGRPAVPTARSSYPTTAPRSSLMLDEFIAAHAEADGAFVDHRIVDEVVDGISDDVTVERGSFLCAPHAGAMQFRDQAQARLLKGVSAGWAVEYAALPFWPLRCDPYSVVDETKRNGGLPKFRLTNDHSWPPPNSVSVDGTFSFAEGTYVQSLNASMDRGDWPANRLMRVQQMAEAGAILQSSGAQVRIGVLDIVAYYKQFGRQLGELYRNGAFSEGGVVIDERCCFGSAADASKCSRISNFLVFHARRAMQAVDTMYPSRDPKVLAWLAARREAGRAAGACESDIDELWACLHAVGMYIDDGSHVSIDDLLFTSEGEPVVVEGVHVRRADAHFAAFQATMARFGLETAKEQPPSSSATLLGVDIELLAGTLKLTPQKRVDYSRQVRAMAERSACPVDDLLSLLGKLGFAALCYPRGRQWLHAPWRCARARYRARDGTVLLSSSARSSLLTWAAELDSDVHEGVPLAACGAFPAADSAEVLCIYADAAGDSAGAGYCAWTVVGDELLLVEGRWSVMEREHLIIADLELAASTLGLVALQPLTGRECVYSFTDNTVAMAAMRNLTPSTLCMQQLTIERVAWLLEHEVSEACERITSKANLWADLGSRARVGELMAQAARLRLRVRRVEAPSSWRSIVADAALAAALLSSHEAQGG